MLRKCQGKRTISSGYTIMNATWFATAAAVPHNKLVDLAILHCSQVQEILFLTLRLAHNELKTNNTRFR